MRNLVLALLAAGGFALVGAAPAGAVGTRYPFCIQGEEYPGLSNCTFTRAMSGDCLRKIPGLHREPLLQSRRRLRSARLSGHAQSRTLGLSLLLISGGVGIPDAAASRANVN